MTNPRMKDKIALVTGAAGGIGQACALRLAEEGADLVLADLAPCDETARLIAATGRLAIAVKVDVTSDAECEAMVAQAVQAFGRVDAGVFSAGIRYDPIAIVDLETPVFERMLDINLTGVLRGARALARVMKAQGHGAIVNIASTAGQIPIAGSGPYCVAKAGVIMLTRVMALELAASGVRVNAVGPGFTATAMWDVAEDSEAHRWAMSMTPMGRTGTPREQADACLYLASDESSYVTGQVLFSAGGQFTG